MPIELVFALTWVVLPFALIIYAIVQRSRKRKALVSLKDMETELATNKISKDELNKELDILKNDLEELGANLEQTKAEKMELSKKYSGITDVDTETDLRKEKLSELNIKIYDTKKGYSEKRKKLKELETQIAIYDEKLAFAELGIYEPHFEFNDSETYKREIKHAREKQKMMVSSKSATKFPENWTVDGSLAKGKTMMNRQTRLTLRAFNNECEAAIANTRWNNVVAMEKRILNSAKAIDRENTSLNLVLSDKYVSLKIDELHLTHEMREQQKAEKEQRAEVARAEREEKRLLAEARAAEKEEQKYQALLAKARLEAGAGNNSDELQKRIIELESALDEAHQNFERAKAMAELTKSGFIYIISNVGSFGEGIVKIGMTRRLDPNDRVKELGDASVPFGFDTHAMIYADNAPALENSLHQEFAEHRVNMANMRKEFFRVSLEDVENAVERLAPGADFLRDREAQEWHETLLKRKERIENEASVDTLFPESI